jgi:hypothetical protein
MQPDMTACPELNLSADRYDLLIFSDVPEPPSIAVLCAGLGLWLTFDAGRRRRASYSIPALRQPSRKWSMPQRWL